MNVRVPAVNLTAPEARSVLVTVLGWIAIVFGALGVYSSVVQMALFGGLLETPLPDVDPALQEIASGTVVGTSVLGIALAGFPIYAG